MGRLRTYVTAAMRWQAAGRPTRSDAEVDRLFREICSQCPRFDASRATCTHPQCGCQVRSVSGETTSLVGRLLSRRLANKLRWATERCPDGWW